MNQSADYVKLLELTPHPEGGYYKEIFRSEEILSAEKLPARFTTNHNLSTLIYYLLQESDKSKFHMLKSDEFWHHLDGCSMELHLISAQGIYSKKILGKNIQSGEQPQLIIPHNTWFAAKLVDTSSFGLVGCTVIPGFEFTDFQMGNRQELIGLFPQYKEIIIELTD